MDARERPRSRYVRAFNCSVMRSVRILSAPVLNPVWPEPFGVIHREKFSSPFSWLGGNRMGGCKQHPTEPESLLRTCGYRAGRSSVGQDEGYRSLSVMK